MSRFNSPHVSTTSLAGVVPLCFLLALYAFAVFGYVTATLATFFVGRDAENAEAELAGAEAIEMLRLEIQALRAEVQRLSHDRES